MLPLNPELIADLGQSKLVPDYNSLISFLLKPLLSNPDALRIDFESNRQSDRVWIRVAFDPEDRERIFGEGGRTIQSVRTVVMTAAEEAGHTARFEVFDPNPSENSGEYQDYNADLPQQDQAPRPVINIEKPKRREINN